MNPESANVPYEPVFDPNGKSEDWDGGLTALDILIFALAMGSLVFLTCAGIALMVWVGADV